MLRCSLIACLVAVVAARSATTHQNTLHEEARSSDILSGELKVAYDAYKDCANSELTSCLKLKLARALSRIGTDDVTVMDGVKLVKDSEAVETNEEPVDIEANLPRGIGEREDALDNVIMDKIFNFFRSHTLQVKLPTGAEFQRALGEERGRRKKLAPLLLVPLLIGGTLVPLAFGALALLAGKALIVSKLALVLAGIIGLKKLVGGGGGGGGHEEVVVSAGHGGSAWGRSYEESQDMAYRAYKN